MYQRDAVEDDSCARDRLEASDQSHAALDRPVVTPLCEAELNKRLIADLVDGPSEKVATIRRVYVDGARTVVAIGGWLVSRRVKIPAIWSHQSPNLLQCGRSIVVMH